MATDEATGATDAACRCGLAVEELVALGDGELDGARSEVARARVRACPTCRRRLAASRRIGAALRRETPLRDDPNGRAIVRARLEGTGGVAGGGLVSRRQVPAVAAVALLGVSALLLGRERPGSDTDSGAGGANRATEAGRPRSPGRPVSAPRQAIAPFAPWPASGFAAYPQASGYGGGPDARYRAERVVRARWERRRWPTPPGARDPGHRPWPGHGLGGFGVGFDGRDPVGRP